MAEEELLIEKKMCNLITLNLKLVFDSLEGVYLDKNVYKLLILGFLILFNFFVGQIFFSFLETAVAVILILISISTSVYLVVHLRLKK